MTVVERVPAVTAIDFQTWHTTHGITTLLFDIEGTLTEWADPVVAQPTIDHLARARSYGIQHIGLVTNINPRHKARVQHVAEQIGADIYRFPTTMLERKPGARMIRSILSELDVSPMQCGFIGDKYVDVLAARNAHVARMAWVERYGTADQWFDRTIYRHLERQLKR